MNPSTKDSAIRLAILASGGATAAEEILAEFKRKADSGLGWTIAGLISDKRKAPAIDKFLEAGLAVKWISAKDLSRADWAAKAIVQLEQWQTTHVLLAGFMRIVDSSLIQRWKGKMVNVHPSLLPRHAGLMDLSVHQSVLSSGDTETGCTLHEVTEIVDAGRIILQKKCQVEAGDTPGSLKEKVQTLEKEITLEWLRSLASK